MADGILPFRDLDTVKTGGIANMPKKIVPLAAIDVSKSEPKENDNKLADSDGRYLFVTVSGGKL